MKTEIELFENEILIPLIGYEDLYSITSFGRVWSHPKRNRFNNRSYGNHFMKLSEDEDGYLRVSLSKNNKKRKFYIHVLVAISFIPNPNDLSQVNHKDCDKKNNNKDNIEWTTSQENHNHATTNNLRRFKKCSKFYGVTLINRNQKNRWCAQLTINKKHIHVGYYDNELDAAKAINMFIKDNNINRPLNVIE